MMASKQSYTAEEIQAWLLSHLAEALKIAPDEIDVQASLDSYGLNSAQAMSLITKTEKMLGFEVSPTHSGITQMLKHFHNV